MDWNVLIIGALTIISNLLVSFWASSKTAALMAYRLEQLEIKVEKHNNVIERTYRLEQAVCVINEQIKVGNHRITDLEDGR